MVHDTNLLLPADYTYRTCAHNGKLCVQPAFFERIVQWVGNAEVFQPSLDPFAAGNQRFQTKKQNGLSHTSAGVNLWISPAAHLWPMVTRKIIEEGCRGVAQVPVTKEAAWFRALGEVALECVDIPYSMGILCTSSVKAIPVPAPLSSLICTLTV